VPTVAEEGGAVMPVMTRDQALELLTSEVQQKLPADEVEEVYNEIFRFNPPAEQEARRNSGPLAEQLAVYFNSGLEIDEIVELWRLIFTRHRNIWYNEEEELIHYNEESEAVPAE
jgi:hypothetical protein